MNGPAIPASPSDSTRPRLGLGALIVAGALGVVAVACGDADSASPGPPAAAAPTSPTRAEDTTPPTDPPAQPPGLADPCALVTAAEAATLAGLEMETTTPSDSPETRTCRHHAPTTGPAGQVEIYVGQGAHQILSTDQRLGHELSEVPGIGDEAFEKDMHIFFRIDRTWYLIRVVRMVDPAGFTEPLRDLAETATGRV